MVFPDQSCFPMTPVARRTDPTKGETPIVEAYSRKGKVSADIASDGMGRERGG